MSAKKKKKTSHRGESAKDRSSDDQKPDAGKDRPSDDEEADGGKDGSTDDEEADVGKDCSSDDEEADGGKGQSSDDEKPERGKGGASSSLMICILIPSLIALIYSYHHEPLSRNESHEGRLWLAVATLVLLIVTLLLSKRNFGLGWPHSLFDVRKATSRVRTIVGQCVIGLWCAASVYGVFNYYQYDWRVISTPGDYADATFYYLNSKYFSELGYTKLYHAMLVSDDEASKRFSKVRRYRDLVGYEAFYSRRQALRTASEVKSVFSPERWEQFRHDVDWITSKNPDHSWAYFFIDHGYNPPPSWTLVGGSFARICPVERVKIITMVDFVLIIGVFACVGWAFGGPAVFVGLLFFLCTFSTRWPILGQSLLRFDWLSCLVVAMCMLKKGYHGLAGGLLTYSALNRVFPALFGFPYVVWMVVDILRARRMSVEGRPFLSREHRRFLLGLTVSLIVFGLGAVAYLGVGAFEEAIANLRLHGSPDSYSSHRVGLGDALVFRFETGQREIAANGGLREKILQLWELQPLLRVLGLLSLIAIALYIWRTRRPVWQLLWLAVFPLFILTTPQINYYMLRLLMVLFHVENLDKPSHRIALVLLFLIEVPTNYLLVERYPRYTVTSATSVGLCVYLVFMIGLLVWEAVKKAPEPIEPAEEPSAAE